MNRIELINQIFNNTSFKNYLEIGSRTGTSLLAVKARRKIAIDPVFKISRKHKLKWITKYPSNLFIKYFPVESDDFFEREGDTLNAFGPIDVALIDGLHTFETSLNDVVNSLRHLNPRGVIVMHDCYPKHELAALPLDRYGSIEAMKKLEGWRGDWNGDVWKAIMYLQRTIGQLLDICVIDSDHGLGIIRYKKNVDPIDHRIDQVIFDEIDRLEYADLIKDLKGNLNLKDSNCAQDLIHEIVLRATSQV